LTQDDLDLFNILNTDVYLGKRDYRLLK